MNEPETLPIAEGQNIKRLLTYAQRSPRRLAQVACTGGLHRWPLRVSRLPTHTRSVALGNITRDMLDVEPGVFNILANSLSVDE